MENKKPLGRNQEDGSYAFDILNRENAVVSSTECTGLMYAPPEDYDEAESYNDIYVIPKVENEREKELRR